MTDATPGTASADWARIDAALDRALDLDGADRGAYLASLPNGLRKALASRLRDALRDDPLLDHPSTALAELAGAAEASGPAQGVRIGPYEIVGLVGEGGMGRVYRARRIDGAFDRTVALKLVRQSLALAGADVAARLRRERDLLAALDHPGIARLLDGGETDDGVPYLVTEFVDGAPITAWADDHALDVPARVRLLAEVARAVDHAHRRFVVHRDLKPSNVMVTERDGAPRPVVLDFGIAKLIDAADEETGPPPLTRTGMRLLTPAYAAPELYEPTATVTTAADVYGLGSLLYQLLTGLRPHDDDPTPGPARTEPTRPSKAVTQPSGDPSAPHAGARARALRGDLDTICLKALHPDPARRYASAADLADDLDRHLKGCPVEARRDSLAYVGSRFVRRHRGVLGAATLALALGLSLAVVAFGREQAARANAEAAADRATEATRLMADLFTRADPRRGEGQEITVREALYESIGRVSRIESLELRGYLRGTLGRVYLLIGDYATSTDLLAAAIRDLEALDPLPLDLLAFVRRYHAANLAALGDHEAALREYQRAFQEAGADPETDTTAYHSLNSFPWLYRELGRSDEAIALSRRLLAMAENAGDEERISYGHFELAESLRTAGRLDDAIPEYERSRALHVARVGDDAFMPLYVGLILGVALVELERPDDAEDHLRRWLEFSTRSFGVNRSMTAHAQMALGRYHLAKGNPGEALTLLLLAQATFEADLPPGHHDIIKVRHHIAVARDASG